MVDSTEISAIGKMALTNSIAKQVPRDLLAHCLRQSVIGILLATQIDIAFAVDMDIMMNDLQRRNEVAPQCRSLLKNKVKPSPLMEYRKGLCLLYGINGAAQEDKALPLLRSAAENDLLEAQLALADVLQKGKDQAQIEALVWYRRAERAGDTRATARYDRLAKRLLTASQNAIPEPPPGTIVNPSGPQMQALYRQGYHCHIMSFGQKWCHNTSD